MKQTKIGWCRQQTTHLHHALNLHEIVTAVLMADKHIGQNEMLTIEQDELSVKCKIYRKKNFKMQKSFTLTLSTWWFLKKIKPKKTKNAEESYLASENVANLDKGHLPRT